MKTNKLKNIAILGSTGSIGKNSLDVISQHPKKFYPLYLTAHRNYSELILQAKEFKPKGIVLTDCQYFGIVNENLNGICKVFCGLDGILEILQDSEIDLVLNSLVGSIGVQPTLFAIQNGKDIALANKEALVMAGQLITETAIKRAVNIFPIDSEHSAIWQCLLGENKQTIKQIFLTASGGPFRKLSFNKFKNITVEQALEHPNWKMGKKITIDSATLMNKGLEVIEAFWLYGLDVQQIKIVIHPQSIIHSMVEFVDGSIKAQLGIPDMRIPIQYALTYPDRLPLQTQFLSFPDIQKLTFEKPNFKKFPTLKLAFQALESGGTAPAALNVANEIAVNRFLRKEIGFLDIAKIIKKTIKNHSFSKSYDLQKIIELEKWATEYARLC